LKQGRGPLWVHAFQDGFNQTALGVQEEMGLKGLAGRMASTEDLGVDLSLDDAARHGPVEEELGNANQPGSVRLSPGWRGATVGGTGHVYAPSLVTSDG
jgi:hypothetical protein